MTNELKYAPIILHTRDNQTLLARASVTTRMAAFLAEDLDFKVCPDTVFCYNARLVSFDAVTGAPTIQGKAMPYDLDDSMALPICIQQIVFIVNMPGHVREAYAAHLGKDVPEYLPPTALTASVSTT